MISNGLITSEHLGCIQSLRKKYWYLHSKQILIRVKVEHEKGFIGIEERLIMEMGICTSGGEFIKHPRTYPS